MTFSPHNTNVRFLATLQRASSKSTHSHKHPSSCSCSKQIKIPTGSACSVPTRTNHCSHFPHDAPAMCRSSTLPTRKKRRSKSQRTIQRSNAWRWICRERDSRRPASVAHSCASLTHRMAKKSQNFDEARIRRKSTASTLIISQRRWCWRPIMAQFMCSISKRTRRRRRTFHRFCRNTSRAIGRSASSTCPRGRLSTASVHLALILTQLSSYRAMEITTSSSSMRRVKLVGKFVRNFWTCRRRESILLVRERKKSYEWECW